MVWRCVKDTGEKMNFSYQEVKMRRGHHQRRFMDVV